MPFLICDLAPSPLLQQANPLQVTSDSSSVVKDLLLICTGRYRSEPFVHFIGCSAPGNVATALLRIAERTDGSVQSIALQAIKTWLDDHPCCYSSCLNNGIVSLLVKCFRSSLIKLTSSAGEINAAPVSSSPPQPFSSPFSASVNFGIASTSQNTESEYVSSITVLLIRSLLKNNTCQTEKELIANDIVSLIVELVSDQGMECRQRCLALHLMNIMTQFSKEILDKLLGSGACKTLMNILKEPPSTTTKFVVMIMNRWAFDEDAFAELQTQDVMSDLLRILRCIQASEEYRKCEHELVTIVMLALGAISYRNTDALCRFLIEKPFALQDFTDGLNVYNSSSKGVGLLHSTISQMVQGPHSVNLVTDIISQNWISAWLFSCARCICGNQQQDNALVNRCGNFDVQEALCDILNNRQTCYNAIISLIHLAQHSKIFINSLLHPGRLEILADRAINDFLQWCRDYGKLTPESEDDSERFKIEDVHSDLQFLSNQTRNGLRINVSRDTLDKIELADSPRSLLSLMQSSNASMSSVLSQDGLLQHIENAPMNVDCSRLNSRNESKIRRSDREENAKSEPKSTEMRTQRWILSPCCEALAMLARIAENLNPSNGLLKRGNLCYSLDCMSPTKCTGFRREDINVPRYDTLRFIVGSRPIYAVGFVLEAHSPFLRGLLGTVRDVQEDVVVPSVTPFTDEEMYLLFMQAVEWCYTGEISGGTFESPSGSDANKIFNLWTFAEFLQMDGLQRYCEDCLEECIDGSQEVLYRCFVFADTYASGKNLGRLTARQMLQILTEQGDTRVQNPGDFASMITPRVDFIAHNLAAELRHMLSDVVE